MREKKGIIKDRNNKIEDACFQQMYLVISVGRTTKTEVLKIQIMFSTFP